jgi:hypothetical protein
MSTPHQHVRVRSWSQPFPAVARTDHQMPLSGCHVVVSERDRRYSLKVFDQRGRLLTTVAPSADGRSVIQGSWRGAGNDGSAWALAVGSSSAMPVTVSFLSSSQDGGATPPIDVTPDHAGYWCTEAPVPADRVVVSVDGRPVAAAKVNPLH